MEIYIKIIIVILFLIICYVIYNYFSKENKEKYAKCDLDDIDIDNLVVIKRTPEYSKLINNLIDEKSFIFSDDQLKVLKNPQQIFNTTKNKLNIENISQKIYSNCSGHLDNNINGNYSDDPIDTSDKEYEKIKKELNDDIYKLTQPNCTNVGVLREDEPFTKNYLKNYYKDVYGNRVIANLSDYFTAYYTLINESEDIGLPINTELGKSNFLIPDQYDYIKYLTNAYNIDWDRMINPISYS